MARQRWMRARSAAAGCVLLVVTGCSSWSPPVFSPALTSDDPCVALAGPGSGSGSGLPVDGDRSGDSALRLQAAVDDTSKTRKRYIHMARCLTQDTSLGAAALIGISSLALLGAMTSAHPTDLAALGVLGGATYLYSGGGDTSIGQRRLVYYAGADALSCTLKAAEPYRLPVNAAGLTLIDLIGRALKARDDLLGPERALQIAASTPVTTKVAGRRAAAGCDRIELQVCSEPAAGASSRDLATFQNCQALRERCSSTPDATRLAAPHPAVTVMLADIVKARDDIDRLLTESADLQANVEMSANLLTEQSARIQTQVAREVDKTFPDIAAVLNSVGGLKAVALSVSKGSALGDPAAAAAAAGKTESDKRAATRDAPLAELEAARQQLGVAVSAATNLRRVLLLVQRRVAVANTELQSCALTGPPALAAANAARAGDAAATPGAGTPSQAGAPAATLVTSDIDPATIAPLLGLPSTATGKDIQLALQACQQKVLNQSSATGVTIDAQTMAAALKGSCRAVPK